MAQNEAAHATIHAHPGTTRTFIDAVCPHEPASGKGDGESVRQSGDQEAVRFPFPRAVYVWSAWKLESHPNVRWAALLHS